MKIFDDSIKKTLDIISAEDIKLSSADCGVWPIAEKNRFLMDRETAMELGGYPRESINLIIGSSSMNRLIEASTALRAKGVCAGGTYLIEGLGYESEKHISFGKIILINTVNIEDDDIYPFTQDMLLADSGLHMEDVMLRQSPTHYTVNLKVGTKAVNDGFDLDIMNKTIYDYFKAKDSVEDITIFLIAGESELYKKLLPVAEKVKEITLTMNHIFDGIEMDCGSCAMSPVCDEVDGLRELHRRKTD